MNKRSAVLIAAGLVIAMGLGALAVSLGLTGPAPTEAAQGRAAPIVRVERRTVTVHEGAEATSTAAALAPRSDDHADGSEHESEHEDEGHEHDDEFEFEDD